MALLNLSQIIHRKDTLTVPITTQFSNTIDLKGLTAIAISTPLALTSTKISFEVAGDDESGLQEYVNSAGTVVEVMIPLNKYIGLIGVLDFLPIRFLRIKTDMVEAAEREFKLYSRRVS